MARRLLHADSMLDTCLIALIATQPAPIEYSIGAHGAVTMQDGLSGEVGAHVTARWGWAETLVVIGAGGVPDGMFGRLGAGLGIAAPLGRGKLFLHPLAGLHRYQNGLFGGDVNGTVPFVGGQVGVVVPIGSRIDKTRIGFALHHYEDLRTVKGVDESPGAEVLLLGPLAALFPTKRRSVELGGSQTGMQLILQTPF